MMSGLVSHGFPEALMIRSARPVLVFALLCLWPALAPAAAEAPAPLPKSVEFNRDIRPILSDNCYFCHGPDKNKREADLRLDTRDGIFSKLKKGAVVAPGDVKRSALYDRVTTKNADDLMPPPDSGKKLTDHEIKVLKLWIEQGAVWEGHWAFTPIKAAAPPKLDAGAARNPIDAFVMARLKDHHLNPSPEADRATLVRRLYLDVTGLPPTPQQADEFLGDTSPRAYERLVDRLLDSPHYGERMAIWWLDLVRYADSVGYHGDQAVSVFPFREYVINAFNQNKRFDRFTIEQFAGDLLPNPTLEQKVASGYNRLGMMSEEGGAQAKEYLAKYASERVRNASGAWMGVTLGCAECHNHKFDPFTAKDFYRFEAFFADVTERGVYGGDDFAPNIIVPTAQQTAELARLDTELAATQKTADTPTPELAAAQEQWEKARAVSIWTALKPASAAAKNGSSLAIQGDDSILAGGANPATEIYTVTVTGFPQGITAFRLDVLPDDSLPAKGPGRAANGNFVLTEFGVTFKGAVDTDAKPVALQNPSADFEQVQGGENHPHKKWAVADALDGDAKNPKIGWAIVPEVGKPHYAIFETKADLGGAEADVLTFELRHNFEPGHGVGRFRISATTAPRPVKADTTPGNIVTLLAVDPAQRNDVQKNDVAAYYRTIAPSLDPVRAKLAQLNEQKTELEKSLAKTLVTIAAAPREVRVLNRGNWMDTTGEIVAPGVPAFLPQPKAAGDRRLTRLDLAQWLVSAENPLTSRVLANRLWKLFFGYGLSRKLDDIGAQGEWPTHPLLLDWLASDLVASGWDIKHAVRQIVMSNTYRQSSLAGAELREKDPYNRLLARQGRFRLDAEIVRDNALAVSGLLVDQLGGPSVKPYQPPGYWAYLNFPTREWQNGSGDDLYRRGLYTHWQRQYLHPSLLAFDAPSREECTADRPRSNTPLQALVLLNDPTYVEAARAFAASLIVTGGATPPERIQSAFRRAVSRPARPAEVATLTELYTSHLEQYKQDAAAAHEFLTVGAQPIPPGIDAAELAAWTSVARTILNLHETISRN
jgi:hypothetical protein